ncbi:MAG: hypothetical protein PHG04_04165 [Candidatus Nanoarchaeia archaeon]|nr:hypothetical protein [Candidatus Nanoarchaeia archaeon]
MENFEFVRWNYLKIATIILFGLVLIILPFNPVLSFIVLLFLVGTWSRIPAMLAEILMDVELCDILTVIIAINMGSIFGGLFGFLVIWFSRIFGPLEDIRATRTESIAFLVCGLLTPLFYQATGSILFSLYLFSLFRYTTVLIVVKLLSPPSVFYFVLLECIIAAPLGFFINTFTEGLIGDFTNNLFKKGLSFDWGLFVFVGIIVLFFLVGKRTENWLKSEIEKKNKSAYQNSSAKFETFPIIKDLIKMGFSLKELLHIFLSIFGLTIIILLNTAIQFKIIFLTFLMISFSFFAKIFFQKLAAKKFDCNASYSFNYKFFFISLLILFVSNGIILFPIMGTMAIIPLFYTRIGAKYSAITSKEKGLIALSGPIINMAIAALSIILNPLNPIIFDLSLKFNLFLALFSLFPIPPFEGSDIIWWNRPVWVISFASVLLMLLFGSNILLSIIGIILFIIFFFIFWNKIF